MSHSLFGIRRCCIVLLSCVLGLTFSALTAPTVMAQPQHPLDHLTAEEIQTAARVLRAAAQFPARRALFDHRFERAFEGRSVALQVRLTCQ